MGQVSAGREGFPEDNESKEVKKRDKNAKIAKKAGEKTGEKVDENNPYQRANQSVPEIPYQFADPCPTSMRDVNITDLSSVNINWKMLTLARPKTKTDEEIFSK